MSSPTTHNPLSRTEAAAYLGISIRKLDELVAGKRIPFYRVGRRVLFDPRKLDRWIEKGGER